MSLYDDVIYLGLLISSILVGTFLRPPNLPSSSIAARKWLSSAIGLAIVFLVSGLHGLHCFAALALQVLLIAVAPTSRLHAFSFLAQFAYLIFFRTCDHVGLPTPPAHTNAVMMIMTIKLIGVALEIAESRKTATGEDDAEKQRYKSVDPAPIDIFHYVFCHAGVLTGPYYKYRTFEDLHAAEYSTHADCRGAVISRLTTTPLYLTGFLLSEYLFPLDAVKEETFYETTSLLYRLFYITPVFFNFRMRMYIGFVLSECSCIAFGLGAYPTSSEPRPGSGPSKFEKLKEIDDKKSFSSESYNFEAVHNIDEYRVETVSTFREALRTWNMTVQYWLVVNVYKTFPAKGQLARSLAVMTASSVWHGVYSGYYLSLGSVPFVLAVEDVYDRILRRRLPKKGQDAYDWVSWFMRVQMFSYLGMAFRLLRIDSTMLFWQSIFYVGHVCLPVFYLLGVFVLKPVVKSLLKTEDEKHEKKQE